MELLTLLLWLWTELESKNGFYIQRNVTLNSNQAPKYNYCRKRMTGLPFSEQLLLIPQADRAYKPGESCGPLSESSWCLWGEFGERNGIPLITNAGWTADRFSPALNPCLFCLEWGPPPSGSWTSGESLQTLGQVEKVKRRRKHGGLFNTCISHSYVLTWSYPALIRIDSPATVSDCYTCQSSLDLYSNQSTLSLIRLLLSYRPGWTRQQSLCRKKRTCTRRLRTSPCVLRWVQVVFRFCTHLKTNILTIKLLYTHICYTVFLSRLFILVTAILA